MEYNFIPTILKLITTVRLPSHEVTLINQLNEFFHFDHNIFLLDSLIDLDRYVETQQSISGKYTPQTVYTFTNRLENKSMETNGLKEITSKNTFLIVAVEKSKILSILKVLSEVNRIRSLQDSTNVKIGFFFARDVTSMDVIQQLFEWSWSARIVKIFVAFHSNVEHAPLFSVFKFDPFGTFHLVKLTGSDSLQNYFPNDVPNFRKYPLRFVQVHGTPLSNSDLKLWRTVVCIFNASASTYFIRPGNPGEVVVGDMIAHEKITRGVVHTYPNGMVTQLLMVPHARPYSDFVTYLKNGTWKLLFTFTFILVAAASLMLIVSGYLRTKTNLLFQCVADVIKLLMNDNGTIRYGQLHRADVFVIVPLTFTGTIVVNGILSIFQSYITLPIYERQINTLDDLYKSPFPILTSEGYWTDRTIENLERLSPQHGGWSVKVHATKSDQLHKDVQAFNNSIAFLEYDCNAQVYLEVQKRFNLKAFHSITETYLDKFLVSYEVLNDFPPYIEPINDIILRLQSAGLFDKWSEVDKQIFVKNVCTRNRHLQFKSSKGSDNGEFTVPTAVWCGWIVSVLVFVCEIIWNKIKPQIEESKMEFSMN